MGASRTARWLGVWALLGAVAVAGCGGEDAAAGIGGGAVEAADTPQETARRMAPLAIAENWRDACLLMAKDESTPYATYPGLMDECVAKHAPEMLDDTPVEAWEAVAEVPDERIDVGANGAGRPSLTYRDESGQEVVYLEFIAGDDGRFYLNEAP